MKKTITLLTLAIITCNAIIAQPFPKNGNFEQWTNYSAGTPTPPDHWTTVSGSGFNSRGVGYLSNYDVTFSSVYDGVID